MAKGKRAPCQTALKILEVLKENPQGLSIAEIRDLILTPGEAQQHLDRRLRELDPFYIIRRERDGQRVVYIIVGKRPEGDWEYDEISKEVRAAVLATAAGRCGMCGRTIEEDLIKLHVDHKIPKSWGGTGDADNLWAICSVCNEGKKNYFETLDAETMKGVIGHKSVHKRIAFLLKLKVDQWVDCDLIEFVANYQDYQTDWRKRLRELRYLGLEIKTQRVTHGNRSVSRYCLTKWSDLPANPTRAAREFERRRAKRDKKRAKTD